MPYTIVMKCPGRALRIIVLNGCIYDGVAPPRFGFNPSLNKSSLLSKV